EHGVLKALGFSSRFLGGTVVVEALLLTALALPVGIALALGLSRAIEMLAPLYLILPVEPAPLFRTLVACLAFSVLGAVLPVRLIAHVDPSRVFGGT
ncbi:MAG: FtsX-like permease family protein, partial [Pseudomonadales bacterium]